jgi:hypothetical protein
LELIKSHIEQKRHESYNQSLLKINVLLFITQEMYSLNINNPDDDHREEPGSENRSPELTSVNFNEGKFMEEDPNLVNHMNNCRDKFASEENKASENLVNLTPEELAQLKEANNQTNIEFTKLINNLGQNKTLFDDYTENLYRQVNALTQILENKKPPVGFLSLDPKKCFEKLYTLTHELSEKMQKNVKAMNDLIIDLGQLKKNDEHFRSKMIKHLDV